MPYWFITFTHTHEVPEDSLKAELNVVCSKWLYVVEYGKKNNNEHYHVLMQSDKYAKTSSYTEYFRKKLYSSEFIENLPTTEGQKSRLVLTKKANNWQKLYENYLIKEKQNKFFKNLRNNGFCEKTLRKLFKKVRIEDLIKCRTFLSHIQAPFVIYKNLLENKQDCIPVDNKIISRVLARLQAEGFIVHHLYDPYKIDQYIWSVNNLIHSGEKNFSLYSV